MTWDILIATVVDRRHLFLPLKDEFDRQIAELGLTDKVKVIYAEDNKEMSIGAKRQLLLDHATADYINYFDSDDFPRKCYVKDIYEAIQQGPDSVGFLIQMTTNGINPKICCHSLRFKKWAERIGGYDYVRNVTHFNPVKRDHALRVGFEDLRFGEDKHYSDKVTRLCRKEVFLDKILFDYRYSNKEPHKQKYGIK